MTILKQALSKINSIHKKQYDFFLLLIQGLIGIAGKRTFRNLARYMEITEHTFARQMAKAFDFTGLNSELIKASKNNNDVLIAAQDATFVSKSGKKTPELDFFWNGSASRPEKGLEVDVIAVIKVNDKKEGYALSAEQSPANPIPKAERKKKPETGLSKIDFCLKHVKKVLAKLIELGVKYMVVDAYFVKTKYVNGVITLGLHVVSKLRKDARLQRFYVGPQKARGRKRKYDNGKITMKDFENGTVTKVAGEDIELTSCIAYSISLKRSIKIILVRKFLGTEKCGEVFLFSTDLELNDLQIYEFYVSRFQIEFIFRDAKGFAGFSDCQSRNPQRMHYHFNASLTAINVARIQDAKQQERKGVQHSFSMTSWSRQYYVEIVINRFISMFEFDQTSIKLHPNYHKLLSFANVYH